MAKYFPETLLIACLVVVLVAIPYAAHHEYPVATVEVAPEKEIVGTCRFQGRYWAAKRDPNGAFRCYLKDAP